jgi:SCP-2 sterol transfer family protein
VNQVRNHPILSEFCDPLPKLSEPGDQDVSGGVNRFGELLGNRARPVSVGFTFTGDGERHIGLRVGPQGLDVVETAKTEQPDFEIVTSEETWRGIAEGEVAPLDAMTHGRLRFRGDVVLASRVVHELRQAAAKAEVR